MLCALLHSLLSGVTDPSSLNSTGQQDSLDSLANDLVVPLTVPSLNFFPSTYFYFVKPVPLNR